MRPLSALDKGHPSLIGCGACFGVSIVPLLIINWLKTWKLLKSQWQKSKSKVLLASFPSYCPLSALRFPIPFHQFLLSMFWAPILGKWTHENLSQHFHVSEDRSNPFSQKNDECSSLSARRCQKYLVRRNCDSSSYIRVTSVESYG